MDHETIQALIKNLNHTDMSIRYHAQTTLELAGSRAVGMLIETMMDEGNPRNHAAAKVLSQIEDERILPALLQVLQESPDPILRQVIAKGLVNFNDARVTQALIQALNDPNALVQIWAIQSLGKLSCDQVQNELIAALHKTPSATIRHTIIRMLANCSDPAILDEVLVYQHDEDHHVRARVADLMQKFGHDASQSDQ